MAGCSGLSAHNKQNAWFFSYFTPSKGSGQTDKGHAGPYVLRNICLSVQIFI